MPRTKSVAGARVIVVSPDSARTIARELASGGHAPGRRATVPQSRGS